MWRKDNGGNAVFVGYVQARGRLTNRFPVGFVAVENSGTREATSRLYTLGFPTVPSMPTAGLILRFTLIFR